MKELSVSSAQPQYGVYKGRSAHSRGSFSACRDVFVRRRRGFLGALTDTHEWNLPSSCTGVRVDKAYRRSASISPLLFVLCAVASFLVSLLAIPATAVYALLVCIHATAVLFSFQVMATLQSALADPHGTSAQRRTAYRVMMGYILGLSDASLAENLSTIVVRGREGMGEGRQPGR